MRARLSIPDPIYEEAEALAARRGISRSELYRLALERYLERERTRERAGDIRENLNRVYAQQSSEPDPFVTYAAYLTFKRVEW